MRLDTRRDGLHGFQITRTWKEVTQGVDAVFSYDNKIYLIKVHFLGTNHESSCFHRNTELC